MTTVTFHKQQATLLKSFLEHKGIKILHSHAQEAVAKINGYRDWNTMSASLQNKENSLNSICLPNTTVMTHIPIAPEIIEGALYELLQKTCSIETHPQNLTVKNDTTGETIGFTINSENQTIEVDGKLKYNDSNPKQRNFLLGAQLGSAIYEVILDQEHASFPGRKLRGRKPKLSSDINSIVKFAENINNKNTYPKKIPSIKFFNTILENHPKLVALKLFLEKQTPIADPRVLIIKIKEMLGKEYFVGWGGTHVHIKMPPGKGDMIALIVAGIE